MSRLNRGVGAESASQGLNSGAPRSSRAQLASSVFDVDPSVKTGRMGGDDDNVQTKPHRAPYQPPTPSPARAPSAPVVDVSDGANDVPNRSSPQFLRDVESVLEAMRAALRARGAVGIRGLARNFQICDTDGSRKLDHDELRKCLRLCKIDLQPHEFEALFTHADSDGSGLVDYEEFLRVVRGRMAPLRRKLVVSIFNGIDQRARSNGHGARDGVITVDDLRDFYSAKEHPDVKAGKRTESAVLQELLDGFEGKKGNRDGSVSLEEWVGYYEETSASIDNDEHFNTTMISAWPMLFDPKQAGEAALPMPVPLAKIDAIEKMLIDAIRARSSGSNETRALETAFKSFDTDKNGTIEFSEFRKAMERFGLATGGHASVSGCTLDVINALFDRYDPDGSGSLSYQEFIKGVFKLEEPPPSARAGGRDLTSSTGTSLPLPSERGDGTRPPTAGASYARGRGGVMGGSMNAAPPVTPTPGRGGDTAGARSSVAGGSFNTSSGIFR